jgi:hypothetical protein
VPLLLKGAIIQIDVKLCTKSFNLCYFFVGKICGLDMSGNIDLFVSKIENGLEN